VFSLSGLRLRERSVCVSCVVSKVTVQVFLIPKFLMVRIVVNIQGDQKVSVHLMIIIQKVTSKSGMR
jgi:hypothetical protein